MARWLWTWYHWFNTDKISQSFSIVWSIWGHSTYNEKKMFGRSTMHSASPVVSNRTKFNTGLKCKPVVTEKKYSCPKKIIKQQLGKSTAGKLKAKEGMSALLHCQKKKSSRPGKTVCLIDLRLLNACYEPGPTSLYPPVIHLVNVFAHHLCVHMCACFSHAKVNPTNPCVCECLFWNVLPEARFSNLRLWSALQKMLAPFLEEILPTQRWFKTVCLVLLWMENFIFFFNLDSIFFRSTFHCVLCDLHEPVHSRTPLLLLWNHCRTPDLQITAKRMWMSKKKCCRIIRQRNESTY